MFTGIIEKMGKCAGVKTVGHQKRLEIRLNHSWSDLKSSESIAVNGVCLTVTFCENAILRFDLLNETWRTTAFQRLQVGDKVNLERALRIGDRLGGHFVTGHVDGVGIVKDIQKRAKERTFLIEPQKELMPCIVKKGSMAVDGVSLTVGKTTKRAFEVYLIPWTLSHTNLGSKKVGDFVNLEVDILSRYARGNELTHHKECLA